MAEQIVVNLQVSLEKMICDPMTETLEEYRKAIATLIAGSEGLHKAIGLIVDSLQQVIEEKKSG